MKVVAMMALGAALSAAGPLPAGAAGDLGARAFRLEYGVAIAGFDVVVSDVRFELDEGGYAIDMRSETTGLPGWFTSWTSRLSSEGGRGDGALLDAGVFTSVTDKGDGPRTLQVSWDEDDQVVVARNPPRRNQRFRLEEYVPVSQLAGTVDPLAALLAVILAAEEGGTCRGRIPVYDGKRRFDVALSRLAAEPGEEGMLCHIELLPVAGDFDDDREDSFWRDPRRRSATVRLASPGPGLPALPVRIDGSTSFGPLAITLNAARTVPLQQSLALP
jgi:hypothetical protein